MLRELDSRQIGEWMAFSMLEPVGKPIPPDPEEQEKAKAKAERAKFEGGMRALMDKQQGK